VRVCRGIETLCLILRAVRYKRVGVLGLVDALGMDVDGEQLGVLLLCCYCAAIVLLLCC
jgi:hypothetical protein